MTGDYELVMHGDVLQSLLACRFRERDWMLGQLAKLAANPFQQGDFIEKGPSGRDYQVKIVGHFSVTFWTDHPVKEVRVVRIERLRSR